LVLKRRLRLVFMGSGAFALPSLEALIGAGHELLAVVTQPDRESGRGRRFQAPPTKELALRGGLPLLQPTRVRAPETVAALGALAPELIVVVAYGQILPATVLQIPPLGCVNVHASLLPRYRGAAPIQWAVARGERETGVTTMRLDVGLDTGPLLLARRAPIGDDETAAELSPRLARLGAELLLETLDGLTVGALDARPQDHSAATLAPLLNKQDGLVDWSWPAEQIAWRVRGFAPWPGMTTTCQGRNLRLVRTRPEGPGAPGEPGEILAATGAGLLVACGQGTALRLVEVQPESRKAMPAQAFALGARLLPGARLG
jgi:methionyl-tRNA formyltransferase